MPISDQPETANVDIVASAGATRAVTVTIHDYAGLAVTGWNSGADTLTVQVWPGDDRATLSGTGVTATWLDAPNGIVQVKTTGAHTIAARKYLWRLLAVSGGTTYEIARGAYQIKPAPGSTSNDADPATAPYTTIDDLLAVGPWIDDLQAETDRAGLAEHQEAARQWFDQIVLDSWVAANCRITRIPGGYDPFEGTVPGPAKWLEDVLATGEGVELSPRVKRACALYACYSACMAQLTTSQENSQYDKKAAAYRQMAANQAITMSVMVKATTTATTYTIPIKLGVGARN